jgi:hypothetical protein
MMMVDNDRTARIRQRAYEIWKSEGRPLGLDQAHWLRAEAEIDKDFGSQGQKGKPAKPITNPAPKSAASSRSPLRSPKKQPPKK